LYNAGHFTLRAWGLRTGLSRGLNVATALGNPVLRHGPQYIGCAAAFMAGIALPLALQRVAGPGRTLVGGIIGAALIGILLLAAPGARGRLAHRSRSSGDLCSLLGPDLMPEREVKIINKLGIHARPAAEIVKTAGKFKSDITIVRDDLEVNAKSIMGVMMLPPKMARRSPCVRSATMRKLRSMRSRQ
jgi:phosphotransferase system HPr (HPr) family protein